MADAEMLEAMQDFADGSVDFEKVFALTWTKMMNSDRFDGPTGTACGEKVCMCPEMFAGAPSRKLMFSSEPAPEPTPAPMSCYC